MAATRENIGNFCFINRATYIGNRVIRADSLSSGRCNTGISTYSQNGVSKG